LTIAGCARTLARMTASGIRRPSIAAALLAGGLSGASPGGLSGASPALAAPARATPAPAAATTFTDPFRYCRAVSTIDAPDARWSGDPVPRAIAVGLRKAFGMPTSAPLEPFERGTSWRCMSGAVWACNVGANLPCEEKADTSRTPADPLVKFCRDAPDADVVPAAVTGRATVYAWRCRAGAPAVVRQVEHPDARGFLAGVWHRIAPSR